MSQQREAKKTVDFVSVIDESIHKKDRSKKMSKIGEKQNKNNRLRSNLLRQSRLNKLLAIQYKLDISRRIKLQMANLFDSDNDRILSYAWTNCELSPELNYTQEQQLFVIQEENPQASLQPIPQVSNSNQQLSSSKQCNPNLLKNLAVTLKSWVNFPEGKHGKQMAEIWKYFKNSKKINKNLVWVLFGDIEEQPEFYEKIQETIPVLKEVSLLQFRSLQKKIRDETVSQLKKSDIEYILKYRRVKDRLEFNKYFYQFVQKLENGAVYNKKSK